MQVHLKSSSEGMKGATGTKAKTLRVTMVWTLGKTEKNLGLMDHTICHHSPCGFN